MCKNYDVLRCLLQHLKLAHPEKPKHKCAPCGWEVAVADLPKHFRESPNHPVCLVCDEGFLGDLELTAVSF